MAGATTTVLRIEHAVPDYESWKREGFDHDPIGRERNGVRRYRVLRLADDPGVVAIELEFDNRITAEAFAAALGELWGQVRDRFGWQELPEARIVRARQPPPEYWTMDGYRLVLFLHLCALLAAIGTSGLLHFARGTAADGGARSSQSAPGPT